MELKAGTIGCIDPGVRGCGYAEFFDSTLEFCRYVRGKVEGNGYVVARDMAMEFEYFVYANTVCIEKPRVYPQVRQRKGDQNDLIDLAMVAGAIAGSVAKGSKLITYYPHEWKGNMPKEKMTKHILSLLSPAERALVDKEQEKCGALIHNVIDAVGIGLFRLGRLGTKVIHYE